MSHGEAGLSRRKMLQMTGAGVLGAGALLAASGCSTNNGGTTTDNTDNNTTTTTTDTKVELQVYDPSGSIAITQLFSPRLDTLEGKTIAFVADDAWEDDRTFPVIKEKLEQEFNATVITQDNFIHGIAAITAANNGIAEQMQSMGVDAAIVGNAG